MVLNELDVSQNTNASMSRFRESRQAVQMLPSATDTANAAELLMVSAASALTGTNCAAGRHSKVRDTLHQVVRQLQHGDLPEWARLVRPGLGHEQGPSTSRVQQRGPVRPVDGDLPVSSWVLWHSVPGRALPYFIAS